MKKTICMLGATLILSACAGDGVSPNLKATAKDVFDAARTSYESKGMPPSKEFKYEDKDEFEGQLWASLASSRRLKSVRVTFDGDDANQIPMRLRYWIGAAKLTNGSTRICDVNKDQMNWVMFTIELGKVISKYEPVKEYNVILEYNSSSNDNVALVFNDRSLSKSETESKYAECRDMKLTEMVNGY